MAIIQISKIQVRSGDLVDLPQLDEAEFGFANDEKRLFIGKTDPNENVEILTSYSSLGFSQIDGANGANLSLSNFEDGQVLTISDVSGNVNVTNRGGTKGGAINLGHNTDVTIYGGSSGQVLTTDGTGNLTWTTGGGGGGGSPGGANTEIQFNDNGSFGGNTGFTFNKISGNFAIPGNGLFTGNLLIANSLNFTDANGSTTDTSVYYTSAGAEGIYLALNGSTRLVLENSRILEYGNVVIVNGNLDTTATTLNLANANSTTVNAFGGATNVRIGATGGLTTLRGNLFIANALNFADANGANTDTSLYYTNDRLVTALNGVDKVLVYNANVTINDDLMVNGAIGLTATACAAINFYDANSTATDTSIYYNSGSDVLTIALNGIDKFSITNANVTVQDDLIVQGALALVATSSATINFYDSNGVSTDTSIYYANNPGLGITEGLYFALNGSTKFGIFNTENQNYGNFTVVAGNINTTAGTFLLANANTTTVNAFGSATNIRIGSLGSLTTLRGNLFIDKALNFADANGANTDTSIYYDSSTEGIYFALNGNSEMAVNNGQVLIVNKLNATTASNVALGDVGNVKILGGTNGYSLITDGTGNLSWANISGSGNGTPGGSNTQIQFNDAGGFGGNNSFTFNKVSGNLQVPGNVDFGGNLILGNASSGNVAINFRDANSTNTDTSLYYTSAGTEGMYIALNNSVKLGVQNTKLTSYQDVLLQGGNLDTTITTLNLANANSQTIYFGGRATSIEIGNASGTTNINHNLDVDGNVNIDGNNITTSNTLFSIANTVATTVHLGRAASNIFIGATGSLTTLGGNLLLANSINFTDANGANSLDTSIYYTTSVAEGIYTTLNNITKTVVENTRTVNYQDLLVAGGNIDTTLASLNLANANTTTLYLGGSATTVEIGNASGTTNINNNLDVDGNINIDGNTITTSNTSITLFNSNATTANIAGAATSITMGAASGTFTIRNSSTVLNGDLAVNGGDITSNQATFNLLNSTVSTLNLGGAAPNINIGLAGSSGVLNIKNDTVTLDGDLQVKGGDITTNQTTFNLLNTTVTTLNIGGAASSVNIGNTGSTTTIRGNVLLANSLNFTDATVPTTDTAIYYTSAPSTEGLYTVLNGIDRFLISAGNTFSFGNLLVSGSGRKVGYSSITAGTGGTVSQVSSRTNGVAINKATGNIVLVSAAGTSSWNTFTVTNSVVESADTISVNQKSGTDKYQIFVTNVTNGSFDITFATTGGTTTEQPVFNFNVIRGVTS